MTNNALKSLHILKRKALVVVFVAGASGALFGCVTNQPPAPPIVKVGFQHLAKVNLKVSQILLKSEYRSPLKAPNVEHKFATSPEFALNDWAKTRLVAVANGHPGVTAQFVIKDASVIESTLPKSKGLAGMITYEPTARYVAHATATLDIQDLNSGANGSIEVASQRSIEVSENATLGQREQAWMELVEKLMRDFNAQMDVEIQKHLSPWVK